MALGRSLALSEAAQFQRQCICYCSYYPLCAHCFVYFRRMLRSGCWCYRCGGTPWLCGCGCCTGFPVALSLAAGCCLLSGLLLLQLPSFRPLLVVIGPFVCLFRLILEPSFGFRLHLGAIGCLFGSSWGAGWPKKIADAGLLLLIHLPLFFSPRFLFPSSFWIVFVTRGRYIRLGLNVYNAPLADRGCFWSRLGATGDQKKVADTGFLHLPLFFCSPVPLSRPFWVVFVVRGRYIRFGLSVCSAPSAARGCVLNRLGAPGGPKKVADAGLLHLSFFCCPPVPLPGPF